MTRSRPTGLLSLGVLVAGLSGCGEPRRVEVSYPGHGVDLVTIQGDVGVIDVTIGSRVRVVQDLHAPEGAVQRQSRMVGKHLQVDTRCKSPVFCSVETRVQVPEGVSLAIELGQGEVWATGVGEMEIELGTGTLDLDVAGPLRARVGQGQIRAETGSNQVVRLAVGQGDIDLVVPRSPWQIDIQASDTQLLGVQRARNARGTLELTAPAGRVRVRATGGPVDSGSPRIP